MKVVVLSPGVPSILNSGLGIVANAIQEELKTLVDVTIVQPTNADINVVVEENTIEVESKSNVFSREHIVQYEREINIAARLDAYHYHLPEQASKSVTEKSSTITEEIERFTKTVLKRTKKIAFDLIYAHDWVTFQTAVSLKKKTGKPFVAHVHSLDYDRGAAKHRSFVFDIEQEALSRADAIIAVSKYTAGILVKHYGVDSKKIVVIHNAIAPFEIPLVKKVFTEKIILFIGRLVEQKKPDVFMEVAEKLSAKRKDLRFVMVGQGDLYNQLVERSAKSAKVKFHLTGNLTQQEVQEILAMSDVYCMPSISEPFGLSALEAAWAGVPVVLSDQSGAAEVLPGALLANPSFPESFIKNIEDLLADTEVTKVLVEKNAMAVKRLTWKNSAAKVVEVFTKCIERK